MSAERYRFTLRAGDRTITMKLKTKIGDHDGLVEELRILERGAVVNLAKILDEQKPLKLDPEPT